MPDETIRKIKVLYKESPDFRVFPVTGIFVAPSPAGDLVCRFFLESQKPPEGLEISVKQTGQFEERILDTEPLPLIRHFQVGLLMNAITAKAVGEFLVKKADEALTQSKIGGGGNA